MSTAGIDLRQAVVRAKAEGALESEVELAAGDILLLQFSA
jgi:hypothetical protein